MKLIYDFKSKGVKGKYIDVVSLYSTLMYYVRYPVGHRTKNCVHNLREKRNNLVTQSIRHVLLFSVTQGPQRTTKIN